MEEQNYECVEGFVVEKYDEDEMPIENAWYRVPIGSRWYMVEYNALSDVRLHGDLGWLEITTEHLERNFKQI